uniref:Ras-associating domain-containing protein n=1 Tax=Steinernema glaseri TaxID=37863 RepID=A0A1I8ABJ2_9BILA
MKCCVRGEARAPAPNDDEEAFGSYQKCNDGYEPELTSEDLKWAAVKEINEQSRDLLFRAPVCVVREEVLAPGLAYLLELELVQTDTLKRMVDYEKARKKPCSPRKNARWFHHTVEIWLKDPEHVAEIIVKQDYELKYEP